MSQYDSDFVDPSNYVAITLLWLIFAGTLILSTPIKSSLLVALTILRSWIIIEIMKLQSLIDTDTKSYHLPFLLDHVLCIGLLLL